MDLRGIPRTPEPLLPLFKERGLEKGDRVAILHPNCHYFLEAYYAIALRGAATVPLNYRLSAGGARH